MNTLLKKDSRLFDYQSKFGSTSTINLELSVDSGVFPIEPIGSVACTCYTTTQIATAITGKSYDVAWQWQMMVNTNLATPQGAAPQDAFKSAVSNGFLPLGATVIDKPVVAYFRADQGVYDAFGNVQSAMQLEYNKGFRRPVGCGTLWYEEWNIVPANGVLPIGKTPISDHEWEICGWDTDIDIFKINAWQGYYLYMPRDVFNATMAATSGSVALTFATTTQEEIDYLKSVDISLYQKAIDLAYNILHKLGWIY